MARAIHFEENSFDEFNDWEQTDKKLYKRLLMLLKECKRTPFEGTGKPEKLKGDKSGLWSRRIDKKNRLVYRVAEDYIKVLSCKGHYDDK